MRIEDLPEPMRAKVAAEHPELVGRRRKRVARPAGPSDLERSLLTQLRQASVVTPVTEHRFHETRKWRFDMAWPDRMLAVEVDGGTHSGGGHNRGRHMASDMAKGNAAILAGWRVLHFDTDMVNDGVALDVILEAFRVLP